MCAELAAYLRARDSGAIGITLVCTHPFSEKTRLDFRFLAPTRDAARMFAALNERLLRDPPPRAVREIALEAEHFATPQPLQGDLFDALGGRTLDWQQALERLQARFGDQTLWTPACVAEHRPEQEFEKRRPDGRPTLDHALGRHSGRPIWLLKGPQAMSPPRIDSDCERIESGWWDGRDATRDYYCVERGGGRAWVFQDRKTGMWFLHGWFG
jgi:protein ImuB